MKKISYLFGVALAAVLIYSCDKIEGPTREDKNTGVVLGDNAILIEGDTIVFEEDLSAPVARVLVEDYTGHFCGTCPPAGIQLNDSMRAAFGDQLVVISVHSGNFAEVCPTALDCPSAAPAGAFTADYRSSVGNAWATKFGISSIPMGMVARSGYPTSHKKTYTNWKAAAQAELNNSPVARFNISTRYDETTHLLKAGVKTEFLQSYTGKVNLQMVVVEDSIVDWQQWYGHVPQLVPDFVHHDVLRASFNGEFGDSLSAATNVTADAKFINGYFTTLSNDWNADKCKVIVFIYDADTYKVIAVAEKEIK
jgi:hypothetical protein